MLSFLDGKKAKIGGIGLMLLALGAVAVGFANGTSVDYVAEATKFLAGLGVFGIRVAMDKP